MDPVSLLFSAIVTGAAAALKPTAEQVVKDAYTGLKAAIQHGWQKIAKGVDLLEMDPGATNVQEVVKQQVAESDALQDEGVMKAAQQVLSAVAEHDADAAREVGVTIEALKAGASIDIGRVIAAAGSVKVRDLTAGQDIRLGEVISGNPRSRQ